MELSKLLQGIALRTDRDLSAVRIEGITADSRRAAPGDLFAAIRGYETDGHDYIDEAVRKGAVAVIADRDIREKSVPVFRVEDSRKTLALLAARFFGDPASRLELIGVTGTNGKTTVSVLLESIFQASGVSTGLMGTMMYRWSGREAEANRTTPDIIELHAMLRAMTEDGVERVVMEVSSHALALHRVEGLRFRAAVFTNLSRDHLDFHDSFDAYGSTKAQLFTMLVPDGVGVLNADDPTHSRMRVEASRRRVTFGREAEDADYRVEDIASEGGVTSFSLRREGRRFPMRTYLWGGFNVMNAAAAAVVGLETGVEAEVVREGISRVKTVRGRMEGFEAPGGFRVVVDYAHTPDALANVLRTVRGFTEGRVIVVFGCGGDRDRGKRPEMGKVVFDLGDRIYVTSDNPRREEPGEIIRDVLVGIPKKNKVRVIENRKEAICEALAAAREQDTVVIAGKGHETYQEIGTERFPFDDRSVAESCLGMRTGG